MQMIVVGPASRAGLRSSTLRCRVFCAQLLDIGVSSYTICSGRPRMRRQLAAIAALLFTVASSAVVHADEQFQKASVSTTGEAIIFVKPDEVVLNFGVETFDQSLEKSKQQNDATSAKIVKAAKDVGVEEKHLQMDAMTIELRYRGNGSP